MPVKIRVAGREVRVANALRPIGLDLDESDYLVVKNGRTLSYEDVLRDGDEVVVVEVPSGG